jgi:hypothetical protein
MVTNEFPRIQIEEKIQTGLVALGDFRSGYNVS